MTEDVKELEKEIKIQKALLQTLDIQFKNSPYNKQPENILRKKEAILEKIEKLEQKRNEKASI